MAKSKERDLRVFYVILPVFRWLWSGKDCISIPLVSLLLVNKFSFKILDCQLGMELSGKVLD